MNDGERSLARGGPGAVMGSKNLKAIVVEGKQRPEIVDEEQFKFMLYETRKLLQRQPAHQPGPAGVRHVGDDEHRQQHRRAAHAQLSAESVFEDAEEISGEALTDKYLVKNASCWACPIGCTRISKTDKVEGEGPEFETTWAFGASCGIDDLAAIIEANAHLQRSGHGHDLGRIDHRLRDGIDREGLTRQRSALRPRRPARPDAGRHGLPPRPRR